jgi:hypothetical protein
MRQDVFIVICLGNQSKKWRKLEKKRKKTPKIFLTVADELMSLYFVEEEE